MTNQLHIKNVWKDRDKYLAIQRKRNDFSSHGLFGSGTPPLTISNVKIVDISCTTDHVGTGITIIYNAAYVGTFDPIYITANASALGFPWYGDYAVGASGYVYCSHTTCKYHGGNGTTVNPGVILYTAQFSPITPDRMDLTPLERPAVIQGGGIELTEVRRVDVNGKPMKNSTGDYYENLPEFYIPGSEIQVSWNVSSNPLTMATSYSFTTNSSAIWGQSAYSGCIGKIACEETFETYQGVQIQYWRFTLPMKFRNDGRGWNFQELDYGYRYLDTSGNVTNYTDPTTGVYGPVFLDGSGHLLGGDGTTNGTDAVVYPPSSGSTPAGYQTLLGTNWSGLSCPVNPFT